MEDIFVMKEVTVSRGSIWYDNQLNTTSESIELEYLINNTNRTAL